MTTSIAELTAPASPPRNRFFQAVFGLQMRFTLLVVGLALSVGFVVGTVTFDLSSRLIKRVHADQCRQTAELLARRAAIDFEFGPAALAALAREMINGEPLLFVLFMETSGVDLARAENPRFARAMAITSGFTPNTMIGNPRYVDARPRSPAFLDVTYPVQRRGNDRGDGPALLGYVRIGHSLERTMAEVQSTIEFLTGVAVLISALTVPLGFLVVRRIVGPLHDLSATIGRFANGELTARSRLHRRDELGELAAAYNDMADRLTQKHLEISQLNAELEERVQQRTHQLRELAIRDALTGLYNRRHFAEVLQRSFAEARRYGHDLACMMIDLDDFKAVNDRCGHQAGDEVLMFVAGRIREELRSSDIAARYGGDEFVVLLPHTDTAQAIQLAARIKDALCQAALERVSGCRLALSVGVASMADVAGHRPDDLVRAADRALYAAKSGGKNTVFVHRVSA